MILTGSHSLEGGGRCLVFFLLYALRRPNVGIGRAGGNTVIRAPYSVKSLASAVHLATALHASERTKSRVFGSFIISLASSIRLAIQIQ